MPVSQHLFTKKVLRHQKMFPNVTERSYNMLLLIADGYCTTKHLYYAANNLNIIGKGWDNLYVMLKELEEAGLINYSRGILTPYRGKSLSVLSCNADGYAFIKLVVDRTIKMASKKPDQNDVKAIMKTAVG